MSRDFLRKAAREEDSSDRAGIEEEQYMRLMPKIGRDFVHKEDLKNIISEILDIVDPTGLRPVDATQDSQARQRAKEYKAFLDDDKNGSSVYKDLIDLSDD